MELLDNPGSQAGRRVVQPIAEGLRLRSLHVAVAPLVGEGLLALACPGQLFRRHARLRVVHVGPRRRHHVQVDAHHPVRMMGRLPAADAATPVAALRTPPLVAKPPHQLAEQLRHSLRVVAALGRLVGKAVAGNRRCDDVEGVGRIAAIRGRIGERPDDLVELHDRTGPAVSNQEREGVLVGRALVDEVDVQTVDRREELIELVQRRFLGAPVEFITPVDEQLVQIGALRAVVPARAR